tara:strand:- start:45192 stop:45494 length:303 start_codon:yes stop_codon:yes gene_type:complete
MELRNINKKKSQAKPKTVEDDDALKVFKEIQYEYSLNQKVQLSNDGKKQENKLTKPYYKVIEVYKSNLGDMSAWFMKLDDTDDTNIVNPYLANHFEPYEE